MNATDDKPEFHVTDRRSAEWLLSKLHELESREALVKSQAETILRQCKNDRDSLMARFGAELEAFARQEIARQGGRRKSLATLYGTLAFRTAPARLEIADTQTAADVAQTLGLVKTAPDLVAYRKAAQEALESRGELLPGVAMTEERETFAVRFAAAQAMSEEEA